MLLHALIIAWLWHDTAVRVVTPERRALTVDIALFEPTPPPLPPQQPLTRDATPTAALAQRDSHKPKPTPTPETPIAIEPTPALPEPVSTRLRFEQSQVAVAADIAQENAPKRRAFAGRSIDAMLPDGDSGRLPGFRPRTIEQTNGLARQLGKLLEKGVPMAATVYDAPLDLLTEGWEQAHHSSDQAACDLEYGQFGSELSHQLCGDVRPPH